MNPDLWLAWPKPNPNASVRLFCVPYAGGSPHVFHWWPSSLPAFVELAAVNLPGRGRRLAEPPIRSLQAAVKEVARAMGPYLDKPFALFGHSMGALICFELAREIRRVHGLSPFHLFASGCFAPHIPDPHPIHTLSEPEFLREVKTMGGMPDEVFANRELLGLVLPAVRADFELTEKYQFSSGPPLNCEITAFGGNEDRVASVDTVQEWAQHTTGGFSARVFQGGHFFLHSKEKELLETLAGVLNRAGSQPADPLRASKATIPLRAPSIG